MKKQKRKVFKIVLLLLIGIVLLVGISYAWFTLTLNGTKSNSLRSGKLSLILGETGNSILLENAYPISTAEGLKQTGYEFQVKNNGNIPSQYTIYLDDDTLASGEVRIDPKYIRYSLEKDNAVVTTGGSALLSTLENKFLINGKIGANATHNYTLKLWVDSEADNGAMDKAFRGKLRIVAEQVEINESCFVANMNVITGYNNTDSNGEPCPKDVVIPSQVNGVIITEIGSAAFISKQLTSVIIPDTVTKLAGSAFARNQLTQVEIPSSVVSIGQGTFKDNQFPDSEAFIYNRNSDGSIDYTTLNSYGGANRENVVFPSTITTIVTYSCNSLGLKNIVLPEGLTKIESNAFADNQLTSITIPGTVTSISGDAFASNQLNDEDAFIYRRNSDGSEDRTYLLGYGGARKEDVVIPSDVKTIGTYAFSNSDIGSITIPSSVMFIGAYAFKNNRLSYIEIPSSVTNIGRAAFNNNQLSDEDAFIYKRNSDGTIDKTILVSYGGAERSNIIVPNTVKELGSSCFSEIIGIENIILPDSLETIRTSALSSTKMKMTSIMIPSSVITIEKGALTKTASWNANLIKVINKTGRSFDWGSIINSKTGYNFVTGTVGNSAGNVEIVSE